MQGSSKPVDMELTVVDNLFYHTLFWHLYLKLGVGRSAITHPSIRRVFLNGRELGLRMAHRSRGRHIFTLISAVAERVVIVVSIMLVLMLLLLFGNDGLDFVGLSIERILSDFRTAYVSCKSKTLNAGACYL